MSIQGKDVLIQSGKYAGLVCNVEQVKDNGRAKVKIAGVLNNEPIDLVLWMKVSQLQGGQHG